MPALNSLEQLLTIIRKGALVPEEKLAALEAEGTLPANAEEALNALVHRGVLTTFHARHLRQGKYKGFLLGSYRVLRPIGRGGMGLVYQAEHTTLQRQVALKILRNSWGEQAGARERFLREGRAVAALDHPNIVRLYELNQDSDTWYLVLEYLQGRSLEERLHHEGRVPQHQAVDYIRQAARGLQHAHDRGIIHRDVKPANLVVDAQGVVKILDLGLARFYEDQVDNLTERVGGVLGSPHYIAPEQARSQVDPRSDIYALGATLYHLLLGQPPFPAPTIQQVLMHHQLRTPVAPHIRDPRISPELSAVVMGMLAKDPEHRFQSPAEIDLVLAPFAQAAPVESSTPTPPSESTTRSGAGALVGLLCSLICLSRAAMRRCLALGR